MEHLDTIKDEVSRWPHTSAHPHRFGGVEFRFGRLEIGHVHHGGIVDIPFPKSIRDALLSDALAEEHHWVPNSGWATFRVRDERGVAHAIWLLRLSYLRYALKTDPAPRVLLDREAALWPPGARLTSLLEPFIPSVPNAPALQD